jgi:hypothetical protein
MLGAPEAFLNPNLSVIARDSPFLTIAMEVLQLLLCD